MRKFTTRQLLEYIGEHCPEGRFELDTRIHEEFYLSFLWHLENYKSGKHFVKQPKDAKNKVSNATYKRTQKDCPFCNQRTEFLKVNHFCDCIMPVYRKAFMDKQEKQMERGELAFAVPLNLDNGSHLKFAMLSYAARSDRKRKGLFTKKKKTKIKKATPRKR